MENRHIWTRCYLTTRRNKFYILFSLQASFGPDDLSQCYSKHKVGMHLPFSCFKRQNKQITVYSRVHSTEHTKSSAVTGSPFLSLATTIFPSLSFISFRLVVSARMAIISLATAISNWACKTEMTSTPTACFVFETLWGLKPAELCLSSHPSGSDGSTIEWYPWYER